MTEKKKKNVHVLRVDDQCTLEFNKDGSVKIGDCKGKKINPGEIRLLDRVNEALGNS